MTPSDKQIMLAVLLGIVTALILLGMVVLSHRTAGPYPDGAPYPCNRWVAECALKRLLAECRADAKQLGCR